MIQDGIEFEEQDSLGLESPDRYEDRDFTLFARILKKIGLIKTQKQSQYVLLAVTVLFLCTSVVVIMYAFKIGFFAPKDDLIEFQERSALKSNR